MERQDAEEVLAVRWSGREQDLLASSVRQLSCAPSKFPSHLGRRIIHPLQTELAYGL
jgi:hypothetical protein